MLFRQSSIRISGVSSASYIRIQCRHATLIRRPKRPYTFTQLVVLSDGSSYTHRTTSPHPVYRSTKDTRNSPLWNPSSQKLLSLESDDAGRLRAFREKYGRGWDAQLSTDSEEVADEDVVEEGKEAGNLFDLLSGYSQKVEPEGNASGPREGKGSDGNSKGVRT